MNKSPLTKMILEMNSAVFIRNLKKDYVIEKPEHLQLRTAGFYFIIDDKTNLVLTRYFIGNQRTNGGFLEKLTRFKNPRTTADAKVYSAVKAKGCSIYFMDFEAVNKLITFGNGFLSKLFTKNHTSTEQNYSEINRLINDKFTFVLQKY